MKVLQVIPMFRVAGAEIMCENLCNALCEQGCEVVAVSLFTEHTPITERLEHAGIKVVYLDKKLRLDLSIFAKLCKLMRKEKPDVVHTHSCAARYALPCAAICGVQAKIHTVHSIAQQEQSRAGKIVNGFLFRHLGVTPVALSEEVRRTVESVYRLSEQRIPVVFNGIDLSKYQVKTDYKKKEIFKILHIGRFVDVKNHTLILNSFAKFAKHHDDVRLQLVGEGELLDDMKELAKKLQIATKVEFAGLQSDVSMWLQGADLFILPSKYEGMPMTLIEAMSTGLPIIASEVGGIPDMLTNNCEAILIKPDVDNLCGSMEKMYSDQKTREKLGTSARKKSKVFSNTKMSVDYIGIYRRQISA